MHNFIRVFSWAFVALMLAACATAPVQTTSPSVSSTEAASPVYGAGDYELGAQDELRVNVFGEPELSGTFVIASNGTLSLPLIGDINAGGMTVSQFQAEMEKRLRNGYLLDPKVSAEVLSYRPFFILGEVKTPGQYPYANGLTVTNAIATAGGFTYRGNSREVIIKSAEDAGERRVRLTPDLVVKPGDTIRVLERIF